MKLHDALLDHTVDQLKGLISIIDRGKAPTRKAQIIAFIKGHLADAAFWKHLVEERLDELQRAAIARMVHDKWSVWDEVRFGAIHGGVPEVGSREYYWSRRQKPKRSPLELVFFSGQSGKVIPEDLHPLLRPLVEPPEAPSLRSSDAAPETIEIVWRSWDGEEGRAQVPVQRQLREHLAGQELAALLQLAEAGELRFTAKTGLPTAATLRAVTKALAEPDVLSTPEQWGEPEERGLDARDMDISPIRAFAWPVLLKSAGLLDARKSAASLTKAGRRALASPLHETLRDIWKAWLKEKSFDELTRISRIKGQSGRGKRALTPPAGRRAAIADHLKPLSVGAWVESDELLRFMIATDSEPTVLKAYPDGLYIGDSHYGYLSPGYFEIFEGSYTRCFLLEYVSTLGLIDVAFTAPDLSGVGFGDHWGTSDLLYLSPYDGLAHINLTALGAWILGKSRTYTPSAPPPSAPLHVLPNLDVVIAGRADPHTSMVLDLFAERSSETTWCLSRGGLLRAIDAGHALSLLTELLEINIQGALPETVAQLFEDTRKRASALSDEGLWQVYEATDSATAAEISHHKATRKLCRRIGDRHLLVAPNKIAAFRMGIVAQGYGAAIVGR